MLDLIMSNIGHLANIRTLGYMDLPNADTLHRTASETIFIQVSGSCQVSQNSNFHLKAQSYH